MSSTVHQHPLVRQLNQPAAWLIAVWILGMIAVPIVGWTLGQESMNRLLVASVVVQAAAVLAVLIPTWGWRRTLATSATVAVLTYLVEFIGSRTGFPFGPYNYTDVLQPQLGHVPLLIPLAWLMMLPCAWAVVAHFDPPRWRFVLLSALALTAWDLMLDPQMVSWDFWRWEVDGGYFGIPWSNYLGWFATAVLLTVLIQPKNLPVRPLLVIYTVTWFLETFGLAFFWGMVGPAVVGGLVMGLFVFLGWRQQWQA